jgi:hypothetical protein
MACLVGEGHSRERGTVSRSAKVRPYVLRELQVTWLNWALGFVDREVGAEQEGEAGTSSQKALCAI